MHGPATSIFRILLITVIFGAPAAAEVTVKIYTQPAAERTWPAIPTTPDSSLQLDHLAETKGALTGPVLLVPHFKIDSTNPLGETTFLTLRNNSSQTARASVIVAPTSEPGPAEEVNFDFDPLQVVPLNISTLTDAAPDMQGFRRGYILILSSESVSADYFQVNTAQDFAAGRRSFSVGDNDDFCYHVLSRFLIGGGFSGGTEMTFFLSTALGGNSLVDPPSVLGDVYDEDGNFLNSFALYADLPSFQFDAADLVLPGTIGGAFDIKFPAATQDNRGGILVSEYKANNKFSTSVGSDCLTRNHPDL